MSAARRRWVAAGSGFAAAALLAAPTGPATVGYYLTAVVVGVAVSCAVAVAVTWAEVPS